MTVYNWSEMAPRERDALVAEKVMGWTGVTYDDDVMCEDWFGFEGGKEDDPNAYWPVPHYTTDISAAWEVVDKMRKSHEVAIYGDVQFTVHMIPDEGRKRYNESIANTAPEAICLAALRAVGVEIE